MEKTIETLQEHQEKHQEEFEDQEHYLEEVERSDRESWEGFNQELLNE